MLVKETASRSDGKVILVGHSAGGMTISAVAEQIPDLLLAIVYLAGFMAPNGMSLLAMLQHETCLRFWRLGCSSATPSPPTRQGSMPDQTTKAIDRCSKLRFCADVSASEFARAAAQLHRDCAHDEIGGQ
jgi:pimeloyl-ACP methyl ester carboxylesterase